MIPRLLRPSAGNNSRGVTVCRLTLFGTRMPCCLPSILIHMQRALCTWPAIIRTVRRGIAGTTIGHNSGGRFSNKNAVTRLFVSHVATTACLEVNSHQFVLHVLADRPALRRPRDQEEVRVRTGPAFGEAMRRGSGADADTLLVSWSLVFLSAHRITQEQYPSGTTPANQCLPTLNSQLPKRMQP